MYKITSILISIPLLSSIVGASAADNSNIEVTAKHVEGDNTTIYARDGVVVYYQNSIIHADKAVYNKINHQLVLDGHVEMIGYQGTKEHATHIEINTQSNTIKFKELFFTNENDIWLLSNNAVRAKSIYTFGDSMLSSCDINDPLWKMYFSSSKYDAEEKYMKLYNTSVYFEGVPVFYTPYLAFSTSKERSSGLLFPLFGYTHDEGFVYEQPVYWAISKSMDLEVNPQIRTDRSLGIYGTLRFADTAHSEGRLRVGYFRDNDDYLERNHLKDRDHYGLEFLYDSSQVISSDFSNDTTDGLYANITLLNDIEYLNLQKTRLRHFGQVPVQESRVNYFIQNDDWYGGLNAKYFIDTRLPHNDTVLQTLPAIQVHKYLKSFIWDNLTYSLDLQSRHLERKTGPTLNQIEMRVPLAFTTSLFDDFLSLSLEEQLYYSRFFFANDDTLMHDYFQYYSNVHRAKLFSDLTGKFSHYTHVVQPSIEYINAGSQNQTPLSLDTLLHDQPQVKDLASVGLPEEQFLFRLGQYVYDNTSNIVFFQRFSQSYYPNRDYKVGDLKNEMDMAWNNWELYSNIYYSFEFSDISEASTGISYRNNDYRLSIGHTYKQALSDASTTIQANDISFDFQYAYNERVAIDGGLIYDAEEGTSKLWRVGGSYTRDCWSVAASVSADVRPRPSTIHGVTDYTQEYGFYIQLNFIPFASINTAQLNTLVDTP